MKKILFILLLAAFSFSFRQPDAENIIRALKTANTSQVSVYFDKMLDIKFPGKDEIKDIGKNQAGIALKSFFDENEINGFELASQGKQGEMMYITGKLLNKDKGHNLTILLKSKEGKPQIITVRIN
jgi:hypothetical protein